MVAANVYPAQWEADVVLADGGTAHLRPIVAEDAERWSSFVSRLSTRTIYYRFFTEHPQLGPAEREHYTNVDYVDRMAFVALLGDEIIGLGRYDRIPGTPVAEVAFVVEDPHQHRGLGSILLEHLAAAARERGLQRFEAAVLTENTKMLRVFRDAGYRIEREVEGSEMRLTFDIEPTEHSVEVMRAREHRAEFQSIARLLSPRTIAVVGASRTTGFGRAHRAAAPPPRAVPRLGIPGEPGRDLGRGGARLSLGTRHPRHRRPCGGHHSGSGPG